MKTSARLILRTHGGLGNQIFQILYARLLASSLGADMLDVHDSNYPHGFKRSPIFPQSRYIDAFAKVVSFVRIPKMLNRLGFSEGPVKILSLTVLDGYFQHKRYYERFPAREIEKNLERLRAELSIGACEGGTLAHLRLGDFFSSDLEKYQFAESFVSKLPRNVNLISNDEALLKKKNIAELLTQRDAIILNTEGLTAEEVLRKMSIYRHIISNDSTLAFWAATLSGADLTVSDQRLSDLKDYFSDFGRL